ncbi:MAG: hypothetical protein ABI229_09695 [Gemmatimonadaceae bacterium]
MQDIKRLASALTDRYTIERELGAGADGAGDLASPRDISPINSTVDVMRS